MAIAFFFFFSMRFRDKIWLKRQCMNSNQIFNFSAHQWVSCTIHRTHKLHFLATFSLKMGLTILFTYLKIILLQYFQFSVFSFNKISSIQTDPRTLAPPLSLSLSLIRLFRTIDSIIHTRLRNILIRG